MNYGVTPQGFIRKSYDTLLSEMQALAQSAEYFGSTIDLSDESPLGAEVKLMAYALGKQWQLAEDIYYSFDIDSAEGVVLNRLTKLGLVEKKDEQYSTGYLKFSGDPLKPISKGTQAETEQGTIFETTEYIETDAEGNALVAAQCLTSGAAGNVSAGSITKIKTPVADITSVTNLTSFVGGRAAESDYELRTRYDSNQLASGSSINAIKAEVLNIQDVVKAEGYENTENFENENGLPAGSIEIIALGGNEDSIAKIILSHKPAGINTFGNVSRSVIDSSGRSHTIRFSRPEELTCYVKYVLSINSNFDEDSVPAIKSAAADYINNLTIAAPAYGWKLGNLLQSYEGIENVRAYLGLSAGSIALDKLTPGIRQIIKTDTSKVVVEYE